MSKAETPHRWIERWRAAVRPAQDDPADLGTAFGLDMSMSPDAPPPEIVQHDRRRWVQRLAPRHKPSA